MTRTIGIAVIGMGWMGEVHSRSYRAIPDRFHESRIQPRLIVCTDAVEARAQATQQRFGFERYTTDWRTSNRRSRGGGHQRDCAQRHAPGNQSGGGTGRQTHLV